MGRTSDANERLLRSAGDLMAQDGYRAVGVSEICKVAGVNKGSFYHFFGSKQDLGLAVIGAYGEQAVQFFEQAFGGDGPLEQKLTDFFRSGEEAQALEKEQRGCTPGCMLGNLALELSTREEPVRQRLEQVFAKQAAILERALEQAREAGEIPDADLPVLSERLLAYFEGVTMMAKLKNDPTVLKDAACGAARLAGI